MMRFAGCLLLASCSAFVLSALGQQPQSAQVTPAETLHANTQLVIVDVVVEDANGRPVHGLKPENFVLTEQKKPQTVRYFEEHNPGVHKPALPMPPMPPGVFTDYTPVAPDSTLNILLLDALNTPMADQMFVQKQLADFVKHEKPGTRIAIFGLANRLIMLQGFTSDPAVLQAVVEHKLIARASTLLDDPVGTGAPQSLSDAMQEMAPAGVGSNFVAETLASMQQFEAEQQAIQTRMRSQDTLDAFNTLAHYLSNFPGRKNLLWFSGSFPLQIAPDPTLNDPFAVEADVNDEFRETMNLLTKAQTAIYPIDGRGLMPPPVYNASNSGNSYARSHSSFSNDLAKFEQSQAQEHATMEEMANDTGGHAFYNTNGLADAAAKAIDSGSNYYTLAYDPSDHNWNGAFRNINVRLSGALAAQGYKLSYRRGYFADDPQKAAKTPKNGEMLTKGAPGPPAAAAPADHAAEAYSRAAVSRGAPEPTDILFKVRVVPLNGKNEDTLARDNDADPNGRMKAPYRTFAVDYVALPSDFNMTLQNDGRRTGTIEFSTRVYDADGNLLDLIAKQVKLNLPPDVYKRFMATPVRFQLMVSAPVKQESFLRLLIRDVPSNRYGVVEIPTAAVGHLPPLEAQNAAAGSAMAPAAAAPAQPTGKQ